MTMVRQASCVSVGAKAILIEGPSGCGKSSLALALIDRGAELVGDDGVQIHVEGHRLMAAPHPATRGLLEIRNLGIMTLVARDFAPVALILELDPQAPRFIDTAEQVAIEGIPVPRVRLWPDSPVLVLRAEWALRAYGLDWT